MDPEKGCSPVKSRLSSLKAVIPVMAIGKKPPNGLKDRFSRVSEVNLASSGGIVDIWLKDMSKNLRPEALGRQNPQRRTFQKDHQLTWHCT